MESENYKEMLEAYAKEMDFYGPLTLKDLIDAHRNLRSMAMRSMEERSAEMQRGFDAGYKSGEQIATKHNYLSREALRSMTLAQLSSILFED